MSICAFFGHRDTPMSNNIERHLEEVVRDLIAQGVDEFWLCEQGTFDCMARLTLKELKKEFKGISLCLLPAYHPNEAKMEWVEAQDYDLIYPDEVANAPPQVAILRRNGQRRRRGLREQSLTCLLPAQSGVLCFHQGYQSQFYNPFSSKRKG